MSSIRFTIIGFDKGVRTLKGGLKLQRGHSVETTREALAALEWTAEDFRAMHEDPSIVFEERDEDGSFLPTRDDERPRPKPEIGRLVPVMGELKESK